MPFQRPTYHHTAMCMLGHPEHSVTCCHAPSGAYECRPPTSRARSTPWICRYPSSATAVTLAQLWIAVSRPPGDPVLRRGRTPDRADPSCLRSRRPSPSLACRPKLVAKPIKPLACLPAEARCAPHDQRERSQRYQPGRLAQRPIRSACITGRCAVCIEPLPEHPAIWLAHPQKAWHSPAAVRPHSRPIPVPLPAATSATASSKTPSASKVQPACLFRAGRCLLVPWLASHRAAQCTAPPQRVPGTQGLHVY